MNCPFDEARYKRFRRARRRAEKVAAALVRGRSLLRRVPARRGDGRARRDDARVRPDEAGGSRRPAHRARAPSPSCSSPEDEAATAYNLVGFQTRMTYGEQARVFRTIPGLEEAEFLRFGSVHRNTFVNAPELLDETHAAPRAPGVFVAGQLAGSKDTSRARPGGSFARCAAWRSGFSDRPFCPRRDHRARGNSHAPRAPRARAISRRTSPGRTSRRSRGGQKLKKRERYEAMAEHGRFGIEADRAPRLTRRELAGMRSERRMLRSSSPPKPGVARHRQLTPCLAGSDASPSRFGVAFSRGRRAAAARRSR